MITVYYETASKEFKDCTVPWAAKVTTQEEADQLMEVLKASPLVISKSVDSYYSR